MMTAPRTTISEAWLGEVLGYLREMDFFKGPEHPSDLQSLLSFVRPMAESTWLFPPGPMDPNDQRLGWKADQLIATLDRHRVWFSDAEVDHLPGDYWYVRTLLDWARISRGHFRPQNFSESWRLSPDGTEAESIEVRFSHDDTPFNATLSWQGGWFDYDLIKLVNQAIHASGYQFASVACISDQCVLLCCLTEAERTKLHKEKGWRFHENLLHSNAGEKAG